MVEDIATAAIRRSTRPLPKESAITGPITPASSELGRLLCARRSIRAFTDEVIQPSVLERLLLDCAGGVGFLPVEKDVNALARTIPQSGGIFSVNTFVLLFRNIGNYKSGIYTLCPFTNSIHIIDEKLDKLEVAEIYGMNAETGFGKAAGIIVLSANMEAKAFKYQERGYRYAMIEVGCALQNALLSLQDQNLAGYPFGGFKDEALAKLLHLNFPTDAPYISIIFGT